MNIKILVAHHKPGLIIKDDIYIPIQVGKAMHPDVNLGVQGDDSGENISYKNSTYCEMTAWYWAWKNIKADYVGLCHYRRYFCFKEAPVLHRFSNILRYWAYFFVGNIIKPGAIVDLFQHTETTSKTKFKELALDFSTKIPNIVENREIDVVYQHPYKYINLSIRRKFYEVGRFYVDLLEEIVEKYFPDFYTYLRKTLDSTTLYSCNMMIMRNEYFQDYCNTMFSILKMHEEKTLENKWCLDLLKEKSYSRVSGYLAEVITSAYIVKMKSEGKKTLEVNSVFLNI